MSRVKAHRQGRMVAKGPQRWLARRRWRLIAFGLVLAALVVADRLRPVSGSAAGASDDVRRYHGKSFAVVRVVDGDTLWIDVPDGNRRYTAVRLWGIDTPELHGRDGPMYYAREAADLARKLAEGTTVTLKLWPARTRGYYGRLLAYVYLPDGRMLNEVLIEAGCAYADARFEHPLMDKFLALERQARQQRVGLWRDVTPEKMPRWRRRYEYSTSGAE